MLINQGSQGFGVQEITGNNESLPFYSTSALHDISGDGVPDALMAGIGELQWFEYDGIKWSLRESFVLPGDALPASITVFPDYDGDLYPDLIVMASNEWPQEGNAALNLGLPEEPTGSSTLFKADDSGLRIIDHEEVMTPAMRECLDGPSWTSTLIPRRDTGKRDLFFVGNVKWQDCLLLFDGESGTFAEALDGSLSGTEQGQLYATMGADFWYEGDTIHLATSDSYSSAIHVTDIPLDGSACSAFDDTYAIPDGPQIEIGWGVVAERDMLLVARGSLEFEPEIQVQYDASIGAFAGEGGLSLYLPDPDKGHVFANDQLPSQMAGNDYFHLAPGDFYGNDGQGDGCLDVVASSMFRFLSAENVPGALGQSSILLGQCSTDFVGVALEAIPGHVGSIVEATLGSGEKVKVASRSNAGVGGTRDPRVRIPLNEEDQGVTSLRLVFPNGQVWSLDAPPLNKYLPMEGWTQEEVLPALNPTSPTSTECPKPYNEGPGERE